LYQAAATLFPRCGGRQLSHHTLKKWIEKGCRARDGRIIRLKTWIVGNNRVTTAEAAAEFLRELNAAPSGEGPGRAE
jgi:hypothetical protein